MLPYEVWTESNAANIPGLGNRYLDAGIQEIPHNAHGALTAEFQPPAACKTLDYASR